MRRAWQARLVVALSMAASLVATAAAGSPAARAAVRVPVMAPDGDLDVPGGLNAVTAISPDNIWAVGEWGDRTTDLEGPLILHWNGKKWTRVAAPEPTEPSQSTSLTSVSAASATNIWAGGINVSEGPPQEIPDILHWNGKAWSAVRALIDPGTRIWSITTWKNDVWAAGEAFSSNLGSNPLMLHKSGASWYVMPVPLPSGFDFDGVAATGPNSVWAVGEGGSAGARVVRWNGTAWRTASSLGPTVTPQAFAVGPSGPAWVVGSVATADFGSDVAYTARWTGKTWQTEPVPPLGAYANLVGVCAAPGGTAWAVGYDGSYEPAMLHWTGKAWVRVKLPTSVTAGGDGNLTGCAVLSATNAWVVGWNGNDAVILHWNGKTWS
jgi:hypothetical protein